jgi:hypothetical protein
MWLPSLLAHCPCFSFATCKRRSASRAYFSW